MRFQKLLVDLLTENIKNKKLFEFMLKKWYGDNPTERDKSEGEVLFTGFEKIKIENRLRPDVPEVKAFLLNYPDFDTNFLPDIRYYTIKQAKYIVSEFVNLDLGDQLDPTPEIFRGRDLPPTDERIEASKQLWFSSSNLIIDKGTVRVYKIYTRKDSINFGYYLKHLIDNEPYNKLDARNQWCITRHIEGSNQYGPYRDYRTFYFVIDESKSPEKTKNKNEYIYYLSALQSATDSPTKLRLTPIENNGSDPVVTPEEIIKIYPQLAGEIDKIIFKKFDENELGKVTDVVEYINENENNQYEFAKVNKVLKKRYIDNNKTLTKPRSWDTMTTDLKRGYIEMTNEKNVFLRFPNGKFIENILSNKLDSSSLNRRLVGLGLGGVKYLTVQIILNDHQKDLRVSLLNKSISLFQNFETLKFGLWNKNNADWVEHNGVKYESNYIYSDKDTFIDENNRACLVEIYTLNGTEDDKSFYCVFPPETGTNKDTNGYFMSRDSWLILKEKIEELSGIDVEYNPDEESDLKEMGEF